MAAKMVVSDPPTFPVRRGTAFIEMSAHRKRLPQKGLLNFTKEHLQHDPDPLPYAIMRTGTRDYNYPANYLGRTRLWDCKSHMYFWDNPYHTFSGHISYYDILPYTPVSQRIPVSMEALGSTRRFKNGKRLAYPEELDSYYDRPWRAWRANRSAHWAAKDYEYAMDMAKHGVATFDTFSTAGLPNPKPVTEFKTYYKSQY